MLKVCKLLKSSLTLREGLRKKIIEFSIKVWTPPPHPPPLNNGKNKNDLHAIKLILYDMGHLTLYDMGHLTLYDMGHLTVVRWVF